MSFTLLKSIQALLADRFADVMFRQNDTEPGNYIAARFFIGALPPKRKHNDPTFQDNGYFPFIVNRFAYGSDSNEESLLTVKTICGIYSAQGVEGGENDIANMVFMAKRLIMTARTLGAFTLHLPLKWSMGNDDEHHGQAHPQYVGQIESTWQTPVIEQQLAMDDLLEVFSSGYK